MRSWAGFVSLTVLVSAFAGCGSTKTIATTGATTGPTALSHRMPQKPPPHVKSATYAVNLAGIKSVRKGAPTRRGAPPGSGFAAISINGSTNELCWTFSQLKNFPAPDQAELRGIHDYGVSVTELSDAKGEYSASSCYSAPPQLLDNIERHPHEFYLTIGSSKHPESGVRGRL